MEWIPTRSIPERNLSGRREHCGAADVVGRGPEFPFTSDRPEPSQQGLPEPSGVLDESEYGFRDLLAQAVRGPAFGVVGNRATRVSRPCPGVAAPNPPCRRTSAVDAGHGGGRSATRRPPRRSARRWRRCGSRRRFQSGTGATARDRSQCCGAAGRSIGRFAADGSAGAAPASRHRRPFIPVFRQFVAENAAFIGRLWRAAPQSGQ